MYNSLKSEVVVPYTLHSFVSKDGTGKKTFNDSSRMCYPAGDTKVITNKAGQEQVSTAQLYLDGTYNINDMDEVTFEDKRRPVLNVKTYYEKGIPSLKVVYL